METIKVPSASQTQKKISAILEYMPALRNNLCPVKDVLHTVGDKWSVLVMMILGTYGTLRFNELKNAVDGISQKMLTATLKDLEAYGLVARKMYPQIPPKVEYSMTDMGGEFLRHLVVMLDWACANVEKIDKRQQKLRVCRK